MKKIFSLRSLLNLLFPISVFGQTQIPIPDTLSGNTIHLNLQNGVKQFFPNINTSTIGYNGNYLGKTVFLQKGQPVTLNVQNQLTDSTTTHWHGLHVSPMNDGSPHQAIPAGNQWSPHFTVLDKAATYWYHPHLHGKTMKQVIKGAAGLIIVRDEEESRLALPRNYGRDDIPLICQFQNFDNVTKQIVEDDELDNTVLVNGTINGFVNCPAQVVRLRLLNASSHRVFRFGFNGNRSFYQITSDDGLLNAPISMTRLNLGSGERAEILINLAGLQDSTLYLKTYGAELPEGYPGGPSPAMMGGMPMGPLDNTNFNILQIKVIAPTQNPITTVPTMLTNNVVWSQADATTRIMAITAQPRMSMTNFFINGSQFNENVINFTTNQDKIEVWNITNQTMMAHPFHIHGNHFYVLQVNGVAAPANMQGRKDVVIVPPMNGSVQLITKYEDFSDAHSPYMYHCHILSHEDHGMMGQFIVNQKVTNTNEVNTLNTMIQLLPNPVRTQLQLKAVLPNNEAVEVRIFDIFGRIMAVQNFGNTSFLDATVPCETWANGLYLLKITQKNESKIVKFLKQ
jgi:blue copper oxidase